MEILIDLILLLVGAFVGLSVIIVVWTAIAAACGKVKDEYDMATGRNLWNGK